MITTSHQRRDVLRRAAEMLLSFGRLSQVSRDAIDHLTGEITLHRRGADMPACGLHVIVSGWACKMRPVADGQRQIFAFLLPGDFIGSFTCRPEPSFYRTVALTPLQTLDVSPLVETRPSGGATHPDIVEAGLNLEDDAQGLIFDHMVRLGARNTYGGLADLLLELRKRMARVDQLDDQGAFRLPVGQRVLAHALGVSVVHVNQTLKRLAADGLIEIRGADVRLVDPQRLSRLIGFADRKDPSCALVSHGSDELATAAGGLHEYGAPA